MAHPATEAASSTAPTSAAEKAADFENFLFEDGDPFEEEDEEQETGEDDFEDEDGDAEEGDEDTDEQAQPAIDPPVSLNAEEKEVFAQLPPEAQQAWAASETRRNQQVQEATTRASEAQRAAEQRAAAADAQAQALYRAQLEQVVSAFAPQEPNPNDYGDIRQYQADKARYDYAKAQHDQFAQQVAAIGVETPEQKVARIQARDAQLLTIPEIADPATRDAYIQSAFALATEMGYEQQELVEIMEARDLKMLAQAARWKADSEELARIRAKSSERIRDGKTGKFRSMKPGAARAPQGQQQRAAKSFEKVKAARPNSREAADAAADWLEATGYL